MVPVLFVAMLLPLPIFFRVIPIFITAVITRAQRLSPWLSPRFLFFPPLIVAKVIVGMFPVLLVASFTRLPSTLATVIVTVTVSIRL